MLLFLLFELKELFWSNMIVFFKSIYKIIHGCITGLFCNLVQIRILFLHHDAGCGHAGVRAFLGEGLPVIIFQEAFRLAAAKSQVSGQPVKSDVLIFI